MTTEIDRTIELSVDGMTCGHCAKSVTQARMKKEHRWQYPFLRR